LPRCSSLVRSDFVLTVAPPSASRVVPPSAPLCAEGLRRVCHYVPLCRSLLAPFCGGGIAIITFVADSAFTMFQLVVLHGSRFHLGSGIAGASRTWTQSSTGVHMVREMSYCHHDHIDPLWGDPRRSAGKPVGSLSLYLYLFRDAANDANFCWFDSQ